MSTALHLRWIDEDGEERLTLNAGPDYADCLLWEERGAGDSDPFGIRCRTKADARALVAYFERLLDTYAPDRRATIANMTLSDDCDEDGDFITVKDATTRIRWRVPQDQADRREILHILRMWAEWVEQRTELSDAEEAPHAHD